MTPPGQSDGEIVETSSRLLGELEGALRSRSITVQCMPDGVEIIRVRDGELLQKLAPLEEVRL